MSTKAILDTVHDVSQPLVLGVGGAVFFGIPLADLLKVGTLVLLFLNIPLAAMRLYEFFCPREKK